MERVIKGGNKYVLRFDRGEDVIIQITNFCEKEGVMGAFFYGFGGASEVKLAYYDTEKKRYFDKTFNGMLEVAPIIGNIAFKNDEIIIHAHATIGREDYIAVAGHVKHLIVGATLEARLEVFGKKLERAKDDETGLNLLV